MLIFIEPEDRYNIGLLIQSTINSSLVKTSDS